jgi:hypothetical protein
LCLNNAIYTSQGACPTRAAFELGGGNKTQRGGWN